MKWFWEIRPGEIKDEVSNLRNLHQTHLTHQQYIITLSHQQYIKPSLPSRSTNTPVTLGRKNNNNDKIHFLQQRNQPSLPADFCISEPLLASFRNEPWQGQHDIQMGDPFQNSLTSNEIGGDGFKRSGEWRTRPTIW